MDEQKRIEYLFEKFINRELVGKEVVEFEKWINASPRNRKLCIDALKLNKITAQIEFIKNFDEEQAWNELSGKRLRYKKKTLYRRYYAAASVALILIVSTILFQFNTNLFGEKEYVDQYQNEGKSQAVLVLGDGNQIYVEKSSFDKECGKYNIQVDGGILSYNINKSTAISPAEIDEYNTLNVPLGGEYRVVLSDGTQVWLNAGSVFKFPVYMVGSREVELSGEAYFEVAKGEQPFIVKAGDNKIQVLGTKFNVSAYEGESVVTTLTQGSVSVESPQESMLMSPGEQTVVDNNGHITSSRVNTQLYTSWKDGIFEFDGMPLRYITTQLSRWYNVDFTFTSDNIADIQFTGAIFRNKPLGYSIEIIESISKVSFEQKENKISITFKNY